MSSSEVLKVVFPHLSALELVRAEPRSRELVIHAATTGEAAACWSCGAVSGRVHSRYRRRLQDSAVTGRSLTIALQVKRFFCDNESCAKTTFAEQVPGLTSRFGRISEGLRAMLTRVGLALGGRAGSRLAEHLAVPSSRDRLLRLVKSLPDPDHATPRVLGVDDFAFRRGRNWGTILIDAQTSTPVDLLPDRTAEDLETWLATREGIEVICRDRAGAYAEGANRAAPEAIQVADRWHLLHNLNVATERVVRANRADLADPPPPSPVPEPDPRPEPRKAAACRDRYAKVKALHDLGLNIAQISERLGLNRTTVRKYARPDFDPASIGGKYPGRRSGLTEHHDYLRARFHEGCHNAAKLHAEVVERGYRGVARSVRRFIAELRLGEPKQRAEPGPSVREATTWITCHPASLTPSQAAELDKICDRSPILHTTRELVADFAQMLVERRGWELETWIKTAQASGIAPLASFATGLYKDWDAVVNGLTLSYSSGVVEGHVNRVKMIKRQMYGRAGFHLLRKRILYPN